MHRELESEETHVAANGKRLAFFSVSLAVNIPTLAIAISNINQFNKNPPFTIVCPEKEVTQFEAAFRNFRNVRIESETSLLSFDEFRDIAAKVAIIDRLSLESIARLSWYYQQALKIAFLFRSHTPSLNLVMWDADTIPLDYIEFFDGNGAVLYGSKVEFHRPYFVTLKSLFGYLPKSYLAFTIQFFSCSYLESLYLIKKLRNACSPLECENEPHWVARAILSNVIYTHKTLEGALFSEQELVGIASLMYRPRNQIVLRYLRGGFKGLLSERQVKIVRIMGFRHISYENFGQINGCRQPWFALVAYMIKEFIRQRLFYSSLWHK
jgi:hypothetical protein